MENRAHALAAGSFVLLLGLGILLAVWWFSGKSEVSRELVLVSRSNVSGLNPQAQVRYRGIRAGKVLDIAIDPADRRNILVTVGVAAKLPLTRGTTARLNYQGVTGLAYVQLEDSGGSGEPLPESEPPPRIALEATPIDSLAARADAVLGQAADVAAKLNRLLASDGHLYHALENIDAASSGLKELPRVMAGLSRALSDDNLKHFDSLLAGLDRTAGQAAPLAVEMRALVASMGASSKRFDQLLADTGGELTGTTLPRVNALLLDLQGNSRALSRLLNELDAAPQSLIFGRARPRPGPGEPGFVPSGN
ncbi:MAG TPA: MlaD family protein [Rhodocyclaceae bacterium]|nr:MlaD family protein [Rhodocyclaceae bacterium]